MIVNAWGSRLEVERRAGSLRAPVRLRWRLRASAVNGPPRSVAKTNDVSGNCRRSVAPGHRGADGRSACRPWRGGHAALRCGPGRQVRLPAPPVVVVPEFRPSASSSHCRAGSGSLIAPQKIRDGQIVGDAGNQLLGSLWIRAREVYARGVPFACFPHPPLMRKWCRLCNWARRRILSLEARFPATVPTSTP
jgi:hypothetical protein